jgi:putative membrane protein
MNLLPARKHVAEIGSEPDPRFTFANERTFLAWSRTALALMIAGGAVGQFADLAGPIVQGGLTVVLIGLGAVAAYGGYERWRRAQIAMRLEQPLPHANGPFLLSLGLVLIGVCAAVAMAVSLFS